MCDIERINKFTKELMNLSFRDLRQLIIEADSDELREYYLNIYNFLLQKKQKEVLKEHVF